MTAPERFAASLSERGWSNADAARELDCAPSYVSGLASGRVTPGLALAARIEEKLGVPCSLWVAGKRPTIARQGRRRAT